MTHSATPLLVLGLSGAALVLAASGHATTSSSTNSTYGTPVQSQAPAEAGLAWGDVDGDGLPDALAIGTNGEIRLLLNFGDGRFEDITELSGLSTLEGASCALFADLDGDELPDLFLGSSATRLWRNLGDGAFEPLAASIDHDLVDLSVQAVDPDGNGLVDLQIHTEAGDLVYRNLGQGRFERLELPLSATTPDAHQGWATPATVSSAGTPDVSSPRRLDVADNETAAQRRLQRWSAGRLLYRATNSPGGSPLASGGSIAQAINIACFPAIRDAAGAGCIRASSVPELGKLYPLSNDFNIDPVTGNAGIGTPAGGHKITALGGILADLASSGGLPSGSGVSLSTPAGEPGIIMTRGNGSGGITSRWDIAINTVGTFVIRDNVPFSNRLTINSAGLVSVKESLEIRGGADIVERFESSCGTLEPGTVVAIDPENPGQLTRSSDAYDSKVAGVVSGAGGVKPGLCLSQNGVLDGDTMVAMNGRVYVKCSTENGAIRPGDRLTTAALAGHAMKVTDEQRSVGAVIGKSMSSLDDGTGLVLVLVNLQ